MQVPVPGTLARAADLCTIPDASDVYHRPSLRCTQLAPVQVIPEQRQYMHHAEQLAPHLPLNMKPRAPQNNRVQLTGLPTLLACKRI
jgi:hypothetical protein